MFRLHRRDKSSVTKSGDKIGFKFSNFQATHVPKGWDGLLVSIVSLENGKTTAKSSKASVRNGSCQWPETLSESIWTSHDDNSKELEEHLFKFVVSMGSTRSGILGEVIINVTDYMKSRASAPVTFPLKKCSHGTTLQVKVQCLTPRSNLSRENKSKDSNSASEDLDAEYPQIDAQSDGSDITYANSHTSASCKDMESRAHPREFGSRETSFSASSPHSSYSTDSPRNNLNGDLYDPSGRQDELGSRHSAPNGSYSVDDPSRSNHSSFNTRITGSENNTQNATTSAVRNGASSRNRLEAAEDTNEEIRAEAKMWERNARKLMVDLELVQKKFSDQSKKQADMEMELSAANTEIDGLKKEVEQLKVSLEESRLNQTLNEEPTFQAKGGPQYRKELEEEIKFQKDTNDNISLQLSRSQESNIELVSVLQELEETIESQKSKIEKLSKLEANFTGMENNIQEQMKTNKILALELQQKKESEMEFLANIRSLEKSLEEKSREIKNECHLNQERQLQDEELSGLEAKSLDANLVEEMEVLKEKVQELEKDCNELTDENFELILKIKDLESNYSKYLSSPESELNDCKSKKCHLEEHIKKKNEDQLDSSEISGLLYEQAYQLELAFALVSKPWYNVSSPHDIKCFIDDRIKSDGLDIVRKREHAEGILNSIVELNKVLDARIVACEEALKNGEADVNEKNKQIAEIQKELEDYISKANGSALSDQELESIKIELKAKFDDQCKLLLTEQHNEIVKLEADMLSKEKEIGVLRQCQSVFEHQISDLSCSVDSHVAVKNDLERKSSELERKKDELELHSSELEQQNLLLSEHIQSLEAQLKHTKDEKEAERLELDNAKYIAMSLQDEIVQLGVEMQTQRVNLNQKLRDMQNQWLEVQQECGNLKVENSNIKDTAETLKNSSELKKENLELNLLCAQLKSELNESREAFGDCSKRLVHLEENISLLVHEYAGKEKILSSEVNDLTTEKNTLSQLYQEKEVEVKTLQQEVEHLNQQLSIFKDEGEIVASNALHEAKNRRDNNTKLEYVLLEVQSQLKQSENELNVVQTESKTKVDSLITELASLKQSHDMLKAANEKMSELLLKYESSEDMKKTMENDLKLKLTVAEYKRQQLLEETAHLKAQLQKVDRLQDEIMTLSNELNAMKIENEKLEASLSIISVDCDKLKEEKISFIEKISSLQKDALELEEYKRNRVALEEKLQRIEGELAEKGALCAQESELKNELNMMKSANRQLQLKIEELEEEKGECGKRAQTLEDEINLLMRAKKDRNEVNDKNIPVPEDTRRSKGDNNNDLHSGNSHAIEVDHLSKIKLLENKLAEALETNNIYKNQLNGALPESKNNHQDNSRSEGEAVPKEKFERTRSSLQAELRDLSDRYLDMSLKYAEVESQREELVMKLKNSTRGKRLGFF